MQPLDYSIIRRFADSFVAGRRGFSLDQIGPYFEQYQPNIPPLGGPPVPTKPDRFIACVQALSPENQRIALLELCDRPPSTHHPMPDPSERGELRSLLTGGHARAPIGDPLTTVSVPGVRENWFRATSRLPDNPAAAVTAARALLESTCKTIVTECGQGPDDSGDIGKLAKQTFQALGIYGASPGHQAEYQVLSGLTTIVNGVAAISNAAGDRHGIVGGPLDDEPLATLVVHACGVVALYLASTHTVKRVITPPP